jgi:succinate dehydrogenase / fumarate reductase membrane anchor subunit
MVARVIVGAHYGTRGWLAQRVTAVVMALYTLLFLYLVGTAPAIDFEVWRRLFEPHWVKLATLLFLASLYLHAWIGVRNIFMDYIKSSGLRLALYVIVIFALVAYAGWSVQILWGM